MKRLISISLLSIMLYLSFNQIEVFVEYIMDVEGFTELYCENKSTPELECNGKCHLAEQLAENEQQKHTKDIQSPPEVILFYANSTVEVESLDTFYVEENISYYFNTDLTEGIGHLIFLPPQV